MVFPLKQVRLKERENCSLNRQHAIFEAISSIGITRLTSCLGLRELEQNLKVPHNDIAG